MAKRVRAMTLTLSEADLAEAVTEWATRKGLLSGDPSSKVTVGVEVEVTTTGYGMSERDEHIGHVVLVERAS